jgi:3-hydroxyisobutyrate dehydrogenase-like beta-hydroxyacid dehydrogenase
MVRQVGFIGLGVMGSGMAKNAAEAGFELTVFDTSEVAVRSLQEHGAQAVATPAEVAAAAEIVVTVLPATPQVEQVYLGLGGIVEGLRQGSITIDCSTISPVTVRKVAAAVAAAGSQHLDAGMTACNQPPRRPEPANTGVSKIVGQAQAGTMKLVVGGDRAAFERAHPVLDAMSQEQVYCGPTGSGMVVKLGNNMLIASLLPLYFEVFIWAKKNGVEPDVLLEAFKGGASNSNVLRGDVEQWALRRRFDPGIFPIDYVHKDLTEGEHAAMATNTPLLMVGLAKQLYEIARARGLGGYYEPTVLKVMEEMAGDVELALEGYGSRAGTPDA